MPSSPNVALTGAAVASPIRTPLNRQQVIGFWAAWFGWMLDGMDSVIYALVLGPAMTELLPRSGYAATPQNVGFAGSLLFGLFLFGWGCWFIWGPLAARFGRHLRGGGLARGPAAHGRRLPADRLLLRLLCRRRAELHRGRVVRLARHVPMRTVPGGGFGRDPAAGERAGTVAAGAPPASSAGQPVQRDLQPGAASANHCHVAAAHGGDHRAVGRHRV